MIFIDRQKTEIKVYHASKAVQLSNEVHAAETKIRNSTKPTEIAT